MTGRLAASARGPAGEPSASPVALALRATVARGRTDLLVRWLQADPDCPAEEVLGWFEALASWWGADPGWSWQEEIESGAALARRWREEGVSLDTVRACAAKRMGTPELLRSALLRRATERARHAVDAAPLALLALSVRAGFTVWDIRRRLDLPSGDPDRLDLKTLEFMVALGAGDGEP